MKTVLQDNNNIYRGKIKINKNNIISANDDDKKKLI